MLIRQLSGLTTARRTLDKALFDQIRLIHILYRAGIFAHRRSDCVQAHRTAFELIDDRAQQLVVDLVQTERVDIQCFQRVLGDLQINLPVTLHLREVPHTAQQRIRYTRRTTTATGYLCGSLTVYIDAQQPRRTLHNTRKDICVVVF